MIRTSYDPEVDALFVHFGADGAVSARTEEVAPGVMIDFDAAGNPIGVEVLDVHSRKGTVDRAGATIQFVDDDGGTSQPSDVIVVESPGTRAGGIMPMLRRLMKARSM